MLVLCRKEDREDATSARVRPAVANFGQCKASVLAGVSSNDVASSEGVAYVQDLSCSP
jgi:hypothetical protein